MKTSITIAIFVIAAAITVMGAVNTLGAIQTAHAAPQSPHGICFDNPGAFGCAGNVGGFIFNRGSSPCINNGPFNIFC